MEYFILNDLGELQCTSNNEPPHKNWTIIPYNGGLIKAIFNGSQWIETATEKEIEIYKELQIENLDLEYTQKINDLVYVHVQKLATRNIPIPKEILDKQQELINEFYKLKL
jgi:hypothetical protein